MSFPTTAECPECGAAVPIPEGTIAGEILECLCSAELEVTETGALILAPEEEEDWGE